MAFLNDRNVEKYMIKWNRIIPEIIVDEKILYAKLLTKNR